MAVTKGEERSAEQAASLFGTSELEGQRENTGRRRKRSNHCKIISVVLPLCLLAIILAVVLSLKKSSNEKDEGFWLQEALEETEQPQCPSGFSRPPLILVSLDGFRAEYLKDHGSHLPVINKLRNYGTTTPYMRPVYPTKTFPNHYSIVTGLYPESHGIVDNKMYDVTRNAFFSLKTDEKFNPKWYQGEPHRKIAFEQRVETVFEWLSLPQGERYHVLFVIITTTLLRVPSKKHLSITLNCGFCDFRPDFITLYLDEPDSAGHRYGPASKQVIEALKNVDRIMGMLMDGLKQKNLHNCVNIIIVSDHGMEEATCEKAAYVSTYQTNTDAFDIIQGPAARIRPKRLPEDYFSCEFPSLTPNFPFSQLCSITQFDYGGLVKNLSCRTPDQPMRPYLKENLPKRMHFANNKRIERGHLYMKKGWQAALNSKEIKYCTGGFHGSDNLFTNMQVRHLLGIRPAPNNGTHGSLNHLLKHPVHLPVHPAQLSHDTPCEATSPIPTDDLQCTCGSQTKAMVEDMNRRLMTTNDSVKASLRRLHHPFGIPLVVQPGATFCLLHHADYLSGYSKDRLMPLWVSYTIQPLERKDEPCFSSNLSIVLGDYCLEKLSTAQCCEKRLRQHSSAQVSTGATHAMNENSLTNVWAHFHDVLLPKYSQQLNGVNIMSGPIFDENADGNVDAFQTVSTNVAPTPTHFFVILTSCKNSTFSPVNCEGPLQAKSFILPNRPDHTESCSTGADLTWVEDWLQFHTARVRDIELLTGLSFYHNRLSVEETLQLKTFLHTV
eukprot:superscaffoldBa00001164_g9291